MKVWNYNWPSMIKTWEAFYYGEPNERCSKSRFGDRVKEEIIHRPLGNTILKLHKIFSNYSNFWLAR